MIAVSVRRVGRRARPAEGRSGPIQRRLQRNCARSPIGVTHAILVTKVAHALQLFGEKQASLCIGGG